MVKFVVKHYASDKYPSIKGNGFDGLQIGEDREEAEAFINFVNKLTGTLPKARTDCKNCLAIPVCRCTPGDASCQIYHGFALENQGNSKLPDISEIEAKIISASGPMSKSERVIMAMTYDIIKTHRKGKDKEEDIKIETI